MKSIATQPPDWFLQAVATPATDCHITSHGSQIHYRRYQHEPDRPLLLFIHGHAAHARWWDFIAPAFIDRFNVISMDLAGTGDSAHRDTYSTATFTDDILAVCQAESPRPAIIVGHSFGGSMTRVAGFRFGDAIRAVVLVDSVISDHRSVRPAPPRSTGRVRFYQSLEQGKRRFRLRPPQPCVNDYIIDYIAGHSLIETPQGFRFKLDQDVFAKMVEPADLELPDGVSTLQQMTCPAWLIYGEQSRFFTPESLTVARKALPGERVHGIADAHHHVFLDQPLAFIERLTRVLEAEASR